MDIAFPIKGIDISSALSQQRDGTCVEGENVQAFEPSTDRSRGGSRPGLVRHIDDQLPHVSAISGVAHFRTIQHLNIVVRGAVGGLPAYPDEDDPDYEADPSSPGPSSSWPTRFQDEIELDWNQDPVPSPFTQTRNPGPRKRKKKGNGRPPSTPPLGTSDPTGVYYLYQCIGQVNVTDPGPFFGTNPAFEGCMCIGQIYLNLVGPPTDARQFPNWRIARLIFFDAHGIDQDGYTFTGTTSLTGPVRICTETDLNTAGPQDNGCTRVNTATDWLPDDDSPL